MGIDRLSIWFAAGHSSVTINRSGVERQTSGRDFVSVIRSMPVEDRALLIRFCDAVVECGTSGDCAALDSFKGGE